MIDSKNQRRKFCQQRDVERKKASDDLMKIPCPANSVKVFCKNCKNPFYARKSDRKRGWGKFCSKSCKACR